MISEKFYWIYNFCFSNISCFSLSWVCKLCIFSGNWVNYLYFLDKFCWIRSSFWFSWLLFCNYFFNSSSFAMKSISRIKVYRFCIICLALLSFCSVSWEEWSYFSDKDCFKLLISCIFAWFSAFRFLKFERSFWISMFSFAFFDKSDCNSLIFASRDEVSEWELAEFWEIWACKSSILLSS